MIDLSDVTDRVEDLTGMVRHDPDESPEEPLVEFHVEEELYGAIPEPLPANDPEVLPEWYKNIEDNGEGIEHQTARRCMSFMESMTRGWIFRLPADVFVEATPSSFNTEWQIDREMLSDHNLGQLGGDEFPLQVPIAKWELQWAVETADGYSVLVTSPMNRFDRRFEVFSGIIDADNYIDRMSAPFLWTGGTFEGTIPAGTPIVQVIPFKRGSLAEEALIREWDEDDERYRSKLQHARAAQHAFYREEMWEPKSGTRNKYESEYDDWWTGE